MVEDSPPGADAIIAQALRDHAQQEDQDSVMEHPTPGSLVDFQEGLLASQEADAIRVHLEVCDDCAGDLERLGHWDPAEPLDEEYLPSPEELTKQRQRFDLRLASKASRTLELPGSSSSRDSGGSSWQFSMPLAATLILGALGLGFWLGALRTSLPEIDTGVAVENFLFHTLSAEEGDLERSAGEQVQVSSEFEAIVLRLLTGDLTPYDAYAVELVSEDGTVKKRWTDLARQPNGTFLLVIQKEGLSTGNYEVVVWGRAGREETVISTFRFVLVTNAREP